MQSTTERPAVQTGARSNGYTTLLVHAEPGLTASHRVEAAVHLARDLDATLIGLGAETFDTVPAANPFGGYAGGELIALLQEQVVKDLDGAESAFRRDASGAKIDWRTIQDYPANALTQMAHAADLIVVSPRGTLSSTRQADPADVVMASGRPVLIVPEGHHHLRASAVVIAWKNTRECRRAIADAMPFLQRADDVVVLAAAPPEAVDHAVFETGDVVANLRRHGVVARALVSPPVQESVAQHIERMARLNNADLIVAGAYGHSRVREWAFGGVTDSLLHNPGRFVLMSH